MTLTGKRIGQQYDWLEKWWEKENTKGALTVCGTPWIANPVWNSERDRVDWHKNLGELLNYHTAFSITSEGPVNDQPPRHRLNVLFSHRDQRRLEPIQAVAGGNWLFNEANAAVPYLRLRDVAAHNVLKAGMLYCDPANSQLFEVFDAALSFRQHVGRPGEPSSEAMQVAQEYWTDQMEERMTVYRLKKRPEHECEASIRFAGGTSWGRKAFRDPLADLYYRI